MNALGAVATASVLVIFVLAKFREGAWVIVLLIPCGVWVLLAIARHYRATSRALELPDHPPAGPRHHVVVMVVPDLNRHVAYMISYARRLSDDVRAVHVDLNGNGTDAIQRKWRHWGHGTNLTILESPHRSFVDPILTYLKAVDEERSSQLITSSDSW